MSAAIVGFTSSAASQFVGTGKIALDSAFEAAAVAAFAAGLTNGITYNARSELGFTTQPIALGTGTQSLASLSGVKPGIGNTASQAMAPTTTLEVRGLAMLADAGISAGLHTAIEGGSFGSALKTAEVQVAARAVKTPQMRPGTPRGSWGKVAKRQSPTLSMAQYRVRRLLAVPGLGSTDIDVVAANGNLIAVGGPAKANNLGKLGQELRIYQTSLINAVCLQRLTSLKYTSVGD
ncbi:DUF637 domain-containing protein [Burkholderia multivorans]|uniref:DUF637 domain-containing protein n=1 Tax=Burkholderia multivorans TaxID=87883 RepID=UPI001F156F67|nr:DUF637 domain-containing protein [Burkholderia multivorans]MCO1364757.1 DUF637 domain-containing protein [Burkholderia multivorans]MCO1378202.1 DUF637 domain-containing protein [Burkholderia multivorans]UQP90018.1 DUF637 domain-containing protein [Burkholderia multivorans]